MTLSEIKEQIKADIAKSRILAINQANINKEKALSNKEYASLDKIERGLVFDIAKMVANNEDVEELNKRLQSTRKQKQEKLKQIGLTEQDLKPNFSCKKCNDTGMIGKEHCDCYKQKLNKYLANTDENLSTFTSFKDFNDEKLLKIKKFLEDFANNNTPYQDILLCGKTGVGKTFLAECTLSEFKKHNNNVLKLSAFQMNELFTKFHTCFDYNRADYLDSMLKADVLLIDDLGTEPMKRNITKEYLYLLLTERRNAKLKTIITTNLDLEDILRIYEERIFSRLADKKITKKILIEGADLRF